MNYIPKHWRGELSLPISFWVNGIAVSALLAMVDNIGDKVVELYLLVRLSPFYDPTLYNSLASEGSWLLAAIMIWPAVSIWQVVGIWRSATRYQRDQTHEWPWGNVAKFVVVMSAVAFIVRPVQDVIEKSSLPITKIIIAPKQPHGSGSDS
jgi:hypothetical protein